MIEKAEDEEVKIILPEDPEDEGQEIEEVEEEAPVDITISKWDLDSANIVADLRKTEEGRKFLVEAVEQAMDDFDAAYSSGEEYRNKVADNYKIYSGFLPNKTYPYENCANAHVPTMLENITRVTAQTFHELFLSGPTFFAFESMSPGNDKMAEILTRHSNWYFRERISDYYRQSYRGIVIFNTVGDVTSHSYYDSERGENRHEILSTEEFFVPYVLTSTQPDYSDVPYKCKLMHRSKSQLRRMKGIYDSVAIKKITTTSETGDNIDRPSKRANDERMGYEPPNDNKHTPYTLVHYDGWMTLPGEEEDRPVMMVFEWNSREVLQFQVREDDDWADMARYEREVSEMRDYEAALVNHNKFKAQAEAFRMQTAAMPPDEAQLIDEALMADTPPPPPVPRFLKGMTGPRPPKKRPIEMFCHASNIENFHGVFGLGPGFILADYSRAQNTLLSQYIDAGTAANVSSFIMSDAVDLGPGQKSVTPGKFLRVTNPTGVALKENFMEIKPSPANPQMFQMIEVMGAWAQSSVGANEILSGGATKSGATWRGETGRLEQAMKQLSVAGSFYAKFIEGQVRNNSKLLSFNMEDRELVYLSDGLNPQPELLEITKDMYRRNFKVTVRADMRFVSQQQRVAEADELVSLIQAMPALQGDLAYQHAATEKALKARNAIDLIPTLGPRPPTPDTPFSIPPPPPPGMVPPGAPPGPEQGPLPGPPTPPPGPPMG